MTIKSLFSQAKYPENLYIGLFQQNCFEKKCRTGVLAGGKINETGPDVDCYKGIYTACYLKSRSLL